MNVEIGAVAAQVPEKEYINGIAIAVYKVNVFNQPSSLKARMASRCITLVDPCRLFGRIPSICTIAYTYCILFMKDTSHRAINSCVVVLRFMYLEYIGIYRYSITTFLVSILQCIY
jgi:hypothetical protein